MKRCFRVMVLGLGVTAIVFVLATRQLVTRPSLKSSHTISRHSNASSTGTLHVAVSSSRSMQTSRIDDDDDENDFDNEQSDEELAIEDDKEKSSKSHVTLKPAAGNVKNQVTLKPAAGKVKKSTSVYPAWWETSWPRTAVAGLMNVFVGDQPLFPACKARTPEEGFYDFEEPRDYISRSKNPCWFEKPSIERGLKCAPYFYVAGVAKCGTSDLFRRIRIHPDVMQGTQKEYHWWDRERYGNFDEDSPEATVNLKGGLTLKDYVAKVTGREILNVAEDLRNGGTSVKIFGDGSPSYLWDVGNWYVLYGNQGCTEPRVVIGQHIRHFYPNSKMILIFRHPTPRLYSRFLSRIHRTPEFKRATAKDFHQYVVNGVRMYRECFDKWSIRHCAYNLTVYKEAVIRLVEGMYPVFMADWLRIYPKEQMLILRYEDYALDMTGVINQVFKFLDLAPLNSTQMDEVLEHETVNVGDMYDKLGPMLPETVAILDTFYQPFVNKFAEILNDKRFLWQDTYTPTLE